MYPLKFNPILKSMIWGGDKLRQYKAIDTNQKNIGETVLVPASIESVHLYPTEKFKLLTSMV